MNIVVTGASGFVGHALCELLAQRGHEVRAWGREPGLLSFLEQTIQCIPRPYSDLTTLEALGDGLRGVEVLVHCAARVHQVREVAADPVAAYLQVNCAATLRLAEAAAKAGVKRFVFLSSVKVNGELTPPGQPFRSDDAVSTQDPYGLSKWKAEQGLKEIAARTGLEVVIVRPPLVYGAGVKANFHSMMRFLQGGIPLPFGAINNRRSLVALPNLTDFIALCCEHSWAAGKTFLISDQSDVSTPQLLRETAKALNTTARLINVPPALLKAGLTLLGKGAAAQRLMSDLTVDSSPATQLLGWKPVLSLQEGLALAARPLRQ